MKRIVAVARQLCDILVALLLFLMMAVTVVDVLGRYVVNRPLQGSTEMVRYLLVLVIFIALPVVTARGGHISVSLVDKAFGPRLDALRRALVNLLAGAAMTAIGWYLWRHAGMLARHGDVIGYLLVPVAPAAYAASLLSAVTGITFLSMSVLGARQWFSRSSAS